MSQHFDLVLSRFGNLLKRMTAKDADFDDLCAKHAEVTAEIRRLQPEADPREADLDGELRRRRAALEDQMLSIMQANTRL